MSQSKHISIPHPSLDELAARTLDLIIVGAGAAGMSAAVYAARRKMDCLVITGEIGGQVNWSAEVANYLGFSMISGYDLSQKFFEHVKRFDDDNAMYDLEVLQQDPVAAAIRTGDTFRVTTQHGRDFHTRAVLVATGAHPRMLKIPGEEKFVGHGVTFCATCDGPLYKDKTIAVIGGGNSAMEATTYLAKLAKQIYLININTDLRGEVTLVDEIKQMANVTVLSGTETLEIVGDKIVEKLRVRKKASGQETEIEVQGVFEEIGYEPNSDAFAQLVRLNDRKEIVINERNETSQPGVYAAGDVTNVPVKQIVVAAGEGAKAALGIYDYLLPKS